MKRCSWCSGDEVYCKYHDEEWGVAVHDDRELFEFLILEGAQAGLSWITILKKRGAYRRAFRDWDYNIVAKFGEGDVGRLMTPLDTKDQTGQGSIVRNRLKILSAINNAKVFLKIREEFGSFDSYIWKWTNGEVVYRDGSLTENELSREISADLVRRGMKFVGPVIIYSYLEAVGVLCNHEKDCFCFEKF
ncbi:DNA-3-methyladenine glycosylase I [Methanococcoides sp. SA1]|nr:DNA-3-methyladenine glycosylase I [Methanococcoides sp. SA1]